MLSNQQESLLKEIRGYGVRVEAVGSVLWVNRDDMVNLMDAPFESAAYATFLDLLKASTRQRVVWAGKTDEVMFLEAF